MLSNEEDWSQNEKVAWFYLTFQIALILVLARATACASSIWEASSPSSCRIAGGWTTLHLQNEKARLSDEGMKLFVYTEIKIMKLGIIPII